MAKKKRAQSPVAKFKIGDKVRVKHGVEDVDYPDMPLGGWAGTVTEIQGTDTFIVRWSKETPDAIHPVLKLGKGSAAFVKRDLRQLSQTEDVWEAGFLLLPRKGRSQEWLGIVVSRKSKFTLPSASAVDRTPTPLVFSK